MKLSTKGRYGLRALIDLAEHSEDEVVSIFSISQRQGISERYLEQLIRKLKQDGYVISSRGAAGGYRLAKPASEISVGDVLRSLEGDLEPVSCNAFENEGGCEGADRCVTKYVWKRINDAISEVVDGITIEELVTQSRRVNIDNKGKNGQNAGALC